MHMKAKVKIKKVKKITLKESAAKEAADEAEAVANDRAELRRQNPPGTYVLDMNWDAFIT